jgi:hypothetical protein
MDHGLAQKQAGIRPRPDIVGSQRRLITFLCQLGEASIAACEFTPLLAWLRRNVHEKGSLGCYASDHHTQECRGNPSPTPVLQVRSRKSTPSLGVTGLALAGAAANPEAEGFKGVADGDVSGNGTLASCRG